MMNKLNNAFTLVEMLITVTIIGVVASVAVPRLFYSSPDEDVMRFKKADNSFTTAINDIASSGKYFVIGDLTRKYKTAYLDNPSSFDRNNEITESSTGKDFCEALSQVLSVTSLNCNNSSTSQESIVTINQSTTSGDEDTQKGSADTICSRTKPQTNEMLLPDNTVIYQANPSQGFGSIPSFREASDMNSEFFTNYKIVCLDLNTDKNIAPFGYLVRGDGKIIRGKRAQAWQNVDLVNPKFPDGLGK